MLLSGTLKVSGSLMCFNHRFGDSFQAVKVGISLAAAEQEMWGELLVLVVPGVILLVYYVPSRILIMARTHRSDFMNLGFNGSTSSRRS